MANQYNIQEIRLLPMDKTEEFKTVEDARDYLATELIILDGKYSYRERGIVIENPYALVLFQYDNSIIGYGILKNVEKYTHLGKTKYGKELQYNGYLNLFAVSIHNITAIKLDEIRKIDKNIKSFSNVKQFIKIEHYDEIYKLLLQKQIEFEQKRF